MSSMQILNCVLLQKSPSETLQMLAKAYGNKAIKKSHCTPQHNIVHNSNSWAVYKCTTNSNVLVKIIQTQNTILTAGILPLTAVRKTLSTFIKSSEQTNNNWWCCISSSFITWHCSFHSSQWFTDASHLSANVSENAVPWAVRNSSVNS